MEDKNIGVSLADYQKEMEERKNTSNIADADMPIRLTKLDVLQNKKKNYEKRKESQGYDDMPMELINRHTEEAQQNSEDENMNRGFSVGIVILVILGLIALVLFVKIATWSIPGAAKAILLGLLLLFAGGPLAIHRKNKRMEKERRLNEKYFGKPGTKVYKTGE